MIMMYQQDQDKDRQLSPIENGMLNVGGYLSPPLPMYQYQQPYQSQYTSLGGMGSYYNDNYGSYYNPYLQRAQQEEAKKYYEAQMSNQRATDLAMIRVRMIAELGRQVSEAEVLERYNTLVGNYEQVQDPEKLEELQLLESFQQTAKNPPEEIVTYETARVLNNYAYVSEKYEDCEDMFDYFTRAEDTLREEAYRKQREAQWNLSGSFNSSDFSSLLDIHNRSNMFEYTDSYGNNREVDISDQIITLPTNIVSEAASRRSRFIEELLKG